MTTLKSPFYLLILLTKVEFYLFPVFLIILDCNSSRKKYSTI